MKKKKARIMIARALKKTGLGFVQRMQIGKLLLKYNRSIIHDTEMKQKCLDLGLELIWHDCPECANHCVSSIESTRGPKGEVDFHTLYLASGRNI